MISMLAIMFLVLLLAGMATFAFFGVTFNCSPFMLFTGGALSNPEFEAMMDMVFNDPSIKLDEYNIKGGGYECWIANGYFSFRVNGISEFTPGQKIAFFTRLDEWKERKENELHKPQDKLNRAKLAEKVFQKQLDSILEKE